MFLEPKIIFSETRLRRFAGMSVFNKWSFGKRTIVLFFLCLAAAFVFSLPASEGFFSGFWARALSLFLLMLTAAAFAAFLSRDRRPRNSFFDGRKDRLANAGRMAAIGGLTPGIAHELNQPLCVVKGYVELLGSVLKDDPILKEKRLEDALHICAENIEKASLIVARMRSLAKKQTSKLGTLRPECAADNALSFFSEQMRGHNISLVREFGGGLPPLDLDEQEFVFMIVALVLNSRFSLDQTPPGDASFRKTITVRLLNDPPGRGLTLEVEDNGAGMDGQVLRQCAEPFFSTKKEEGSAGLGLCVVDELARSAGGRMEIFSKPGQGCRTRIFLPASVPGEKR